MAEKIVLIDGHSILNRAYYGIPVLTNSEGKHTNAVYGFLNILFKVLEEEQAGYVAVAFDLHAPTFRHKMYEAYKGTRKPMPEELREQVPMMKEMLSAMKIPVMSLEGYEADDILGTVSRQMEREGMDVSIVSGDRDLLQLATEKIRIRIPKTKATGTEIEDYYAEEVQERYQVTPTEFIDVKALMGDASDNIPGVPGIGRENGDKNYRIVWLHRGGVCACGRDHTDEARESLREHYDLAQISARRWQRLIFRCRVSLEKGAAKIENLYTKEALELCRRLEFKNLLNRFQIEEEEEETGEEFSLVQDFGEAEQLFERLKGKAIAVNLGSHEEGALLGAAICVEKKKARFVACGGFLTEAYLGEKISEAIAQAKEAVTIHLKEQMFYLKEEELKAQRELYDASIAAYLLNPLKGSYECEDLAHDYLNWMIPSRNELIGKKGLCAAKEEGRGEFLTNVCRMAAVAYEVWPQLRSQLNAENMWELFETVEMPLAATLYHMEKEGIGVKREELKAYGEQLTGRIAELEQKIYEEADEAFNINSPKQLGVILFEKLQLPHGKKTKTGYSTAADVLEKLAEEYPIVSDILEYRQLTKLKSTYADGLANYIQPDGRIHGKFHQTITATGRLSSAEPNLQNIPIRMELGRLIRKVFVPKDGYVFLDADYSQIELRVLAHLSGDEMLIQAYQDAAGYPYDHGFAGVPCSPGGGDAAAAPQRESGQFRNCLWH